MTLHDVVDQSQLAKVVVNKQMKYDNPFMMYFHFYFPAFQLQACGYGLEPMYHGAAATHRHAHCSSIHHCYVQTALNNQRRDKNIFKFRRKWHETTFSFPTWSWLTLNSGRFDTFVLRTGLFMRKLRLLLVCYSWNYASVNGTWHFKIIKKEKTTTARYKVLFWWHACKDHVTCFEKMFCFF